MSASMTSKMSHPDTSKMSYPDTSKMSHPDTSEMSHPDTYGCPAAPPEAQHNRLIINIKTIKH